MKKFPVKYLPLIGIILLLSVTGYFLIHSGEGSVEETVPADQTAPDEVISTKNLEVYLPDPDKGITLTLKADESGYAEKDKGDILRFKKFSMKYDRDEGIDFDLTGDRAEYDESMSTINLYGGLKCRTSNGYEIYTEQLVYKKNEDCLVSDEHVTVIGPFFTMEGKGLFVDLKDETVTTLSNGKLTFDKEPLTK